MESPKKPWEDWGLACCMLWLVGPFLAVPQGLALGWMAGLTDTADLNEAIRSSWALSVLLAFVWPNLLFALVMMQGRLWGAYGILASVVIAFLAGVVESWRFLLFGIAWLTILGLLLTRRPRESVHCSSCSEKVPFAGNPAERPETFTILEDGLTRRDVDQWSGNVCVPCRRVFCRDCINTTGPTPCPRCSRPTVPAQRMHLAAIGAYVESFWTLLTRYGRRL